MKVIWRRLLDGSEFEGFKGGDVDLLYYTRFVVNCAIFLVLLCFLMYSSPFWTTAPCDEGIFGWRGRQTMERERCGAVGNRSADLCGDLFCVLISHLVFQIAVLYIAS